MFKWTCLATVVIFALGCGDASPSQSARTSTSAAPVLSAPSAPSGKRATAEEIRRLPPELKAHLQNFEGESLLLYEVTPGVYPCPPGNYDLWDFEQGHFGLPRP